MQQEDDNGLLLAIEQTIDALTFAQTHIVDIDFRAHSKSTIDSVISLQEEQRSRVDAAFRAVAVTPNYIAQQLLHSYRGEAQSLALGRELAVDGDALSIIDDLSDHQVKAFKKEMKQRIHEWEGCFRETNGREAAPQDKVMLRPIYELYKHAKNRVLRGEATVQQPIAVMSTTAGASASQPSRASASSFGVAATSSSGTTPMRSSSTLSTASAIAPNQTPDRNNFVNNTMYNVSPAVPMRATSMGVGANTPSGAPSPYTSASAPTQPFVVAGASPGAVQVQSHVAPVAPGQAIPLEDLIQEKRRIKRMLHQFEAGFEQRFGRKPTRDDRREYSREYHRYGELKALLNEHAKAGDD